MWVVLDVTADVELFFNERYSKPGGAGVRKSSVAGNSGFSSFRGAFMGPGVCPESKKRALLLPSASFEFTGKAS